MLNLTSKEVASRIDKRSAIGFVLEVLGENSIPRTPENYQEIRNDLLALPSEMISLESFKTYMKKILYREETVIVIFRKPKQNGKIGHKGTFRQGYFYYLGDNMSSLKKIYVHWQKEKEFLLANLDSMRMESIYVKKHIVECIPNIFCMNLSLSEKGGVSCAEISIYVGCNKV